MKKVHMKKSINDKNVIRQLIEKQCTIEDCLIRNRTCQNGIDPNQM